MSHTRGVAWNIEFVAEAERWWDSLNDDEQAKLGAAFDELERHGPLLPTFKSKESEAEFWDTHDSTDADDIHTNASGFWYG